MTAQRPRFLTAALWSVAGEFVARLVPPAVVAYLVRILPAEDFGVVAAAMIVIGFCQVFWDAGLSRALVQTDADERGAANVVFWTSLAIAIVAYLLVLALALPLSRLFSDPRLVSVLPVIGLQILLAATSASFTALLQRRMEFRRIFVARLSNALVAAATTLLMVSRGYSYEALIGGVLAGSLGQLVVLVVASRWRPHRGYDRAIALSLWRFSRWAMLTGLLAWFFVFADSLIVGAWLDTRSLGIYNTTTSLMALTLGLCVAPILPVLYSLLVKMRGAPEELRQSLVRASRAIAFVVAPVSAIAIALSGPTAAVMFGPSWSGVEQLLVPIALAAAFSWLAVANNEAYRARGEPELETRIMLVCAIVYLAGYLVAIRFGLTAFAWTRCGLAAFGFAVHLWFAGRYLGIHWTASLGRLGAPLGAGALTAVSGWLLLRAGVLQPESRLGLAAAGGGLAIVYLAFILLVARDFVREEVPAILFPRGPGRT